MREIDRYWRFGRKAAFIFLADSFGVWSLQNFGAYLLKYTASMRRKFYLSATWIVYGI